MTGLLTLYNSTIGKKVAMALSGIVYVGWVCFHLLGNLNFFLGPEAMNDYAHKLQSMPELVWSGRTLLFAAIAVHIVSAISLIRHNAEARGLAYQGPKNTFKATAGSKSMRFGGFALLAFIVWHLADFTIGTPNGLYAFTYVGYEHFDAGFVRGEVYHNMVRSFTSWTVVFYLVGMAALGLHLYHGVWSVFQTLGYQKASTEGFWRSLAIAVALVVVLGNLAIVGTGVVAGAAGWDTTTGHGAKYYGYQGDMPVDLDLTSVSH